MEVFFGVLAGLILWDLIKFLFILMIETVGNLESIIKDR